MWEPVAEGTYRLRVPSGWIYRVVTLTGSHVIFVPDHEKFVAGRWIEG